MRKLLTLIAIMLLGFIIVACEPGEDNQVFQYDVVFDLDGGELDIENQSIWENRTATKPNDPIKEGYQFLYWANAETLEEWNFVNNKVNEDLTLVAVWGKTHRVIFDKSYGEDSVIEDFLILTESKLDERLPLKREGYTFVNWTVNGEDFDFENEVVIEDLLIVATWEVNEYTITFDSNGGSLVEPVTQDFGTDLEKPIDPVLEGHHLVGWFTDEALTEEYVFDKVEAKDLTLYAKWAKSDYTISFDTNGGDEILSATLAYDETIELPTPTRKGWNFIGWYLDGEVFNLTNMPANDLVLTANWSQVPVYNVFFDGSGANEVLPTARVLEGDNVLMPQAITKEGHTFIEWQLDGMTFDFNTSITEDITLVALWQVNQYTITFDSNGGSSVDQITLAFASNIQAPIAPTKEGYTFIEWQLNENTFVFDTMQAEDITLVAKWNINQYTITFDSNGGNVIDNLTLDYSSEIELPIPVKEGHTFIGWLLDGSLFELTSMPANNLELVASWEVNQYTITFDSNGGDEQADLTLDYSSEIELPIPVKEGHTFVGWLLDGSLFELTSMPASDLELVASWDVNEYTIIFDSNGGNEQADLRLDFNSEIILPIPEKLGHTFVGWLLDGSLFELTSMPASDLELVASWGINEYTVTFNTSGGIEMATQTVLFEELAEEVTPIRKGYEFIEWQLDGNSFDFNTPITKDIELVATWFEISYLELQTYIFDFGSASKTGYNKGNVNFTNGDGIAHTLYKDRAQINAHSGDQRLIMAPINTFNLSFVEFDLSSYEDLSKIEFIYSTWNASAYDRIVGFDDAYFGIELFNGEEWIKVDENINLTDDIDANIYTKASFSVDGPGLYRLVYNAPSAVSGNTNQAITVDDVTLFQNVDDRLLSTVSFNLNYNDLPINEVVLTKNSKVAKPENPIREGYTFIEWQLNNKTFDFNTLITEEITLTALWEVNEYTISFNSNGGNTLEDLTLDFNSEITLSVPVKEGYTFKGWLLDGELFNLSNMPATDLLLVADWEINNYTISFNTDGGEPIDSITLDFNSEIELPIPEKLDHTFIGWLLGGSLFDLENMPARDIELVADWTQINTYIVTFDTGGGNSITPQKIEEGNKAVKPDSPTKDGFEFLGWFLNDVEFDFTTIIDSPITLVAKWEEIAPMPDSEKINYVIDELSLLFDNKEFDMESEIELPTTSLYDSTISWTTNPEAIVDGKWFEVLVDTPVELTATITVGETTKVISFEVTIKFVDDVEEVILNAKLDGDKFAEAIGKTTNTGLEEGTEFNGIDYAEGLGLDSSIFTVELIKNAANMWAANGGVLRGYHNASGGNLMRIKIDDNYLIKDITINLKGANKTGANSLSVNSINYTFNISSISTGTDSIDINEINSKVIEIQSTHTNRMYIHTIDISYVSENGNEPEEPVEEYTVIFDTDGGNPITPQTIEEGNKAIKPDNPKKDGFEFLGWFIGENEFDFDTLITEAITLTAHWEEAEPEEPGDEVEVTTEYIFDSNSWGTSQDDWTSGKTGNQYQSGRGIQVTSGASGANGTTKITFYNVKSIEITYSTNASKGAGTIVTKVGNETVQTFTVSTSGGTTNRSAGVINVDSLDGAITITINCTTNSIYLYGIKIVHTES
ncbi:InlB B-repeat-containing protein [Acholeplasma laidlawii]|uniref:InlB B-repeat-containing protein n=1 Tax=Acholeplasma laidlawii TaxID=2148 RepID=UPI0018C3520F|nr:InlB B-repeat-containing protein [Acholeplasma laidlawii]MBG0761995.1 InlB B-repeat-containing protein [Acholeplasma laidlawii]